MINFLHKLPNWLGAIGALLILVVTTTIGFIPVFLIGILKLIPIDSWQQRCTKAIEELATAWCSVNNFYVEHIQKTNIHITNAEALSKEDWYLVVANHQSWLDIVILHKLFNRKIPILKFFVKDQLKWVPLLGFCWWAMGCPFMKRYSKAYLEKNPHKQGKDILSTQKAINKFKQYPASIMNFIEGTRFTFKKQLDQQSPYKYLLKPKSGGIGFIISSMGEQLNALLDVTIVYQQKNHSLWDFLCKRVNEINVIVRSIPIPEQFKTTELVTNSLRYQEFQDWLNQQWALKDELIGQMRAYAS